MTAMNLSLPALFARSLQNASKAYSLPNISEEAQEQIQSILNDLKSVHTRIVEISLFSPNETLEDISTRDLVYLFVPYVLSEMQGRLKTVEREERMASLKQAENYLESFLLLLDNYEIVPEEERLLYSRKSSIIADPAKRRELKINQFKREKDLKGRIETIRKRRGQSVFVNSTPTDYDLIAYLLPTFASTSKQEDDEDFETGDILREATLLLLRLTYAQGRTQQESMEQEWELLKNAPPSSTYTIPDDTSRSGKQRENDDDMWRLDKPIARGGPDGNGPLLDPTGKPLRPFTILPSNAGERARLQAQVFGPGHRLPTMSIDEYLEIERERGNIITGGGPASQAVPTSSDQLTTDSEMDGTREGAEKDEQKRQKEESWARFTDENPRGAGNTMNRG